MDTLQQTARAPGAAFHIAFGVDAGYFRYMAVTIASIVENNPGLPLVFHVFAFSVSDDHQARLRQLESRYGIAIHCHTIDREVFREFTSFPSFSQYSLATFIRLLIPATLQGLTDRVLYMDADILCTGSLAELLSIDLKDNIAAVVSDHWETTASRQCAALGLRHQRYFNAGVMLIHIGNWIAHDVTQQAMQILVEGKRKLPFQDQDALNIVLDGRALFIDEKWNFRYNLEVLVKEKGMHAHPEGKGVLLHFTGRVKPWHEWSLHESRDLFLKYQSLSPWAGTPLDLPRNYKEMRMYSRFLMQQKRLAAGGLWYLKYLSKKLRAS